MRLNIFKCNKFRVIRVSQRNLNYIKDKKEIQVGKKGIKFFFNQDVNIYKIFYILWENFRFKCFKYYWNIQYIYINILFVFVYINNDNLRRILEI